MESGIIFDVATKPFPWQPIWAYGGAFFFGFLIIFLKKIKWRHAVSEKWGYFMILCAVVAAGYYTGHWYLSRQNHIKVLANRRYEFVQGVVENLHPMPDDGSSKESFTISGHIFLYSDYDELGTTNCFDQTQPHGGPIHNGMLLRVKFIDDCILRLEVPSENSVVNDK